MGLKATNSTILLVDDDKDFVSILKLFLENQGFQIVSTETIEEAKQVIANSSFDLALLDVNLPDGTGIDLVPHLKSLNSELDIIMVSGEADTGSVVKAIQKGASDYVSKPCNYDELLKKIKTLLEIREQKHKEIHFEGSSGDNHIIGSSPVMKNLVREIIKVSSSDSPVVLHGESGTGKTLFAKIIHDNSPRKSEPFIVINCAAIPSELLESEFFGHVKGSFTGAIRDKPGKFEQADKGTIFLDEIGDLALDLQAKLLRVLQGKEFERVGGLKTIHVDVRVIAATNRNLEQLILEKKFREDLYYRLNVLPVYISPLRHRKLDITNLVEHYIAYYSRKQGKNFNPLSKSIMELFIDYQWPGNIRELQNVIERAVVLANPPFFKESDFLIKSTPTQIANQSPSIPSPENMNIKEIEKSALVNALKNSGGNVSQAADLLKISRDTIYRRMKKYKIGLKR